jgi:hypothetical protein
MKKNLFYAVLAVGLALVTGYFVGRRYVSTKFPNDIVVSFDNCTSDCDQTETAVKTKHRQCRDAWQEEASQAIEFCKHAGWGEVCQRRIAAVFPLITACEDEYEVGMDKVKACRIRCNNLISIHQ